MSEQFGRTELKYDIREVDSAYLVHNIDWAFRVWREQPWGKKVSFENFCEYVLPYRVGDECPVEWRERLYDKYNSLLDSIRLKPESVFPWIVADALLDSLKKRSPRFVSYSYAKHSAGPEIADRDREASKRKRRNDHPVRSSSNGAHCYHHASAFHHNHSECPESDRCK